ncbi:hypothetical protein ACFPAF_16435 [Hymenobacter endophyticus]|uniref:Uncharacterized protein n=1 Tax=Hymenobacter endophyticus TaxID=3076335 RepID=A0ABU3TKU0_9BACT|nr:hypothetical protein [Hymenobacter endophyticus]MDU0371991.1 hypothetical protein [Hymenobacter endophyticus]
MSALETSSDSLERLILARGLALSTGDAQDSLRNYLPYPQAELPLPAFHASGNVIPILICFLTVVLLLLLGGALLRSSIREHNRLLEQRMGELKTSLQANSAAVTSWHNARPLLQQRDRLLTQFQFALTLPPAEYETWKRLTWKEYAYCTLNHIRLVRPLTFQDYRQRVLASSATYDPEYRRFSPTSPNFSIDANFADLVDPTPVPVALVPPPPGYVRPRRRPRLDRDLVQVVSAIMAQRLRS